MLLSTETSVGDVYSCCLLPTHRGGKTPEKSPPPLPATRGPMMNRPKSLSGRGCRANQSTHSHGKSRDRDQPWTHPAPCLHNGTNHPRSAPLVMKLHSKSHLQPLLGQPSVTASTRELQPTKGGDQRRKGLTRSAAEARAQHPGSARSLPTAHSHGCSRSPAASTCSVGLPSTALPGRLGGHEANCSHILKWRKFNIWGEKK